MAATEVPLIISVDDHVIEPPGVWADRLPRKHVERGPRIELRPAGTISTVDGRYVEEPGDDGPPVAWWRFEDRFTSLKRHVAAAGFAPEEIDLEPIRYDQMRPGCWQPGPRLDDMDINGVEASMCFPNYPRFCGQQFLWADDRELAELCVRAYNDWMVDEWCGSSGGRLIPLCLVPLWDAELAAAAVRRNAGRGVRAVAFSELPAWLGLPSIHSGHWDPFFRACDETGTVICMHIGSGTKTIQTSDDAPEVVSPALIWANSAASMVDFLVSDVLDRFEDLKLLYAECQIGWIPFMLERADDAWLTHQWSRTDGSAGRLPSERYRDRVYSCFFKDSVGIEILDRIGVDQVMFESDYPHLDSTWPHTHRTAGELFGHLDPSVVDKIARGNAARLLGVGR